MQTDIWRGEPTGRKSSDIRVQSIFPNRDSNASSTAQIKQAFKKKKKQRGCVVRITEDFADTQSFVLLNCAWKCKMHTPMG